METEWLILHRIWDMRKKTKCHKFVGALTIELLRKELVKLGFNVSNRDVFIEGISYELDLLVVKSGKQPKENIAYCPDDVLAVLEIKFRESMAMVRLTRLDGNSLFRRAKTLLNVTPRLSWKENSFAGPR